MPSQVPPPTPPFTVSASLCHSWIYLGSCLQGMTPAMGQALLCLNRHQDLTRKDLARHQDLTFARSRTLRVKVEICLVTARNGGDGLTRPSPIPSIKLRVSHLSNEHVLYSGLKTVCSLLRNLGWQWQLLF